MIRLLPALALLLLSIVLSPAAASAHGGEDHAEATPAASAAAPGAGGERTAYGQTGAFELLVKLTPPEDGKDASLMVFLADYATNAPIEHAKIELEIQAPTVVKAIAEPAGSPGRYHALARIPAGKYPVIATVEGGGQLDFVEIKELDLSPAPPSALAAAEHRHFPWTPVLAGAGALLVLGLIVALARRRAGRVPTSAATLLLLLLAPWLARGHGGEDHAEAPAPAKAAGAALPAGTVYMAKESQFLLGVRTVVAREREIEARVEAVGRVIPRVDGHAAIAAPQPGRIVPVKGRPLPFLGDVVEKGQPLFVIEQTLGASDSGALQSQAIQARSAIAQARARRDQAARELERKRSLEGVVAQKEIQQAELDVELASRELQLAEQQAALFGGGSLQRLTVTSPIDGTIAAANVSIGEQVAADRELYTIIEASTLWVEADIFEADVPRVEQSGGADLRVEGHDTSFPAKVYRIGQLVDPTTRTVKVILSVDNARGLLRPGMFARVAVAAGQRTTALVVPDAAVMEEGGRRFVFVHTAPEEFVRREVVLGAREADDFAVKVGVKPGERVVTQGTYQLRTSK